MRETEEKQNDKIEAEQVLEAGQEAADEEPAPEEPVPEKPADQFQRTRSLIGAEALQRLHDAKVLVFGVGGVGGYVCEALVRAGVGQIDIVDKDVVDIQPKVEVCAARMRSINPKVRVKPMQCFYLPEKVSEFSFGDYDYIVDAIDNVTAKIDLICRAKEAGVPILSSMGTGNKLNPGLFRITDIEKTRVCPLAKVIRKELKKRGVRGVQALYSEEEPAKTGMRTPASISFVPSAAGLMIAGEVVRYFLDR